MYYLFLLGTFIASVFSRKFCYLLARTIALAKFYFFSKGTKQVIENLSAVISDEKERKIQAKNVFINFSYYLVDFLRYPKLSEAFLKKYVKVSGLEKVKSSLIQHKGVIALTAHLGNYELAGAVTSLLGYPVSAVALPHRNRRINEFFNRRRKSVGIEVISTGAAVRTCFSSLQTGRILALLGDKDFSGSGLKVRMFSRWVSIPRGAAFFALKTNAPIIPAFFVRADKYFYHLIFEKPIISGESGLTNERQLIQEYIVVLERYIKQYPGQWYAFGKYWLPEDAK